LKKSPVLSKRSVIVEVLDRCAGGGPGVRGLLHQNAAVNAILVSGSNLSLVLAGNAIAVGHGYQRPIYTTFELARAQNLLSRVFEAGHHASKKAKANSRSLTAVRKERDRVRDDSAEARTKMPR
jgi:hypothetical protein